MMNKSRHMHWQTAGKGGKLEVPVECLPNIYDVYEELGRFVSILNAWENNLDPIALAISCTLW